MNKVNDTTQLEPLFCKNTGAYLAQTADFCSHVDSPRPPFKIVPPLKPVNIDAFSWVEECPGDMRIRPHPDTEIRRNVRSILNRKNPSVSLLINHKSGCFAEFDSFPEEVCKNYTPLHALAGNGNTASLAVCLIRHRLLESDQIESLCSHKNTNVFKLEEGCEFLERDGHPVIRNRYSGRAFRMDHLSRLLISGKKMGLDDTMEDLFPLFQKLCFGGILRQVFPVREEKT